MTEQNKSQSPEGLIKFSLVLCVGGVLMFWTLNMLIHLLATEEQMIRLGLDSEMIASFAGLGILFPLVALAVTIACLTALIAGTCPFVHHPDKKN